MHTDAVTGKALTASAKGGNMFELVSDYRIMEGKKFQTLLRVTGSRKNFHNGKHYTKSAKTNTRFST